VNYTFLHIIKSCSSPIASQQFARRGADDFNNELTQMLDRVLNGPQSGLNLEKLCIIPGQQCWIVYIDAIVSCILQLSCMNIEIFFFKF